MGNYVRRRSINYSIKRQFQFRVLLRIMVIVFITVGINGLVFYLFSNQEIGNSLQKFHVQARSFLDILLPVIIASLVLGTIAAFVISLYFPHRIAGPLYRIEKDIRDKLSEGNLSVNFAVRKNDDLGELAESLNLMEARLRSKVDRIRSASKELSAYAEGLNSETEPIRHIKELARKVEESVKEFKS